MRISAILLVLSFTLPAAARAQTPIPITNAGFESATIAEGFSTNGVIGWTTINGTLSATFTENLVPVDSVIEAPEGQNVATIAGDATLAQTVNAQITPGKSYVLSYFCTNRDPAATNVRVTVSFRINGTTVLSEERRSPVSGTAWNLHTVTYTHPLSSFPVSAIEIRIGCPDPSATAGVWIDQVALTETNGLDGYDGTASPLTSFDKDPAGSYPQMGIQGAEKFFAMLIPNHVQVIGTPAIGFPTQGTQYVELSNNNNNPGPASTTLGTFFYAVGDVVSFDWKLLTQESVPSGTFYNDTVTWSLNDYSTGASVQVAGGTFAQTNDTTLGWTGSVPAYTSAIAGNFANATATHRMDIAIPAALRGKACFLMVAVANGGDNFYTTSLLMDNVRILGTLKRPGTGDGLRLGTGVDSGSANLVHYGEISGGVLNDEKSLQAGDTLHVGVDTTASNFLFQPIFLAGQAFTTGGAEPLPIPAYGLWINTGAFLLVNGAQPTGLGYMASMNPGGDIFSWPIPVGLAGNSMVLQLVVPSVSAANGIIGTSEAHVLRFL